MAYRAFCDVCKNECPDGGADIRLTINNLPMILQQHGARHLCDPCWQAHARKFAHEIQSAPAPIRRQQ
jgi:hypothetical protein